MDGGCDNNVMTEMILTARFLNGLIHYHNFIIWPEDDGDEKKKKTGTSRKSNWKGDTKRLAYP